MGHCSSVILELSIKDATVSKPDLDMKKLPSILLMVALVAFVAGLAEGFRPGGWGVGVPFGAVFLGLAFITKILQKETVRFDEEERQRQEMAERAEAQPSTPGSK
jgi:hypothetical protein